MPARAAFLNAAGFRRWAARFVLVVLITARPAYTQVVTLAGAMTVDNAFTVYISTSDSELGTPVISGNNWPQTFTFTVDLAPSVINYLHVVATDYGAPAAFIGSFTLSTPDFRFADGTQTLLTTPASFDMSYTAFGSSYVTPSSVGTNGVGPWGFFGGINASAQWLGFPGGSTVYFSARITPAVPEPETVALLAAGILTLGVVGLRRKLT